MSERTRAKNVADLDGMLKAIRNAHAEVERAALEAIQNPGRPEILAFVLGTHCGSTMRTVTMLEAAKAGKLLDPE